MPPAALPKTIFVIDDWRPRDMAEKLCALFPEAAIRGFSSHHPALVAIEDGAIPDMLFLDAANEENERVGAYNAKEILDFIREKNPEAPPPGFIFYSNSPVYAEGEKQGFLTHFRHEDLTPQVAVADIDEIIYCCKFLNHRWSLQNLPPQEKTFRNFLKATYGISVPLTTEEMVDALATRTQWTHEEFDLLQRRGRVTPAQAIAYTRADIERELAVYDTQLVVPEDDDGNLFPFITLFSRAAGDVASGPVIFDKAQLEKGPLQTRKPVLVVDDASAVDIVDIFQSVAGIVVLRDGAAAHLEVLAEAHGISALLGTVPQAATVATLEDGGLVLDAAEGGGRKILYAGEEVTLHPGQRTLYPRALDIEPEPRFQSAGWLWRARDWLQEWCAAQGLHPPHFKKNISSRRDISQLFGCGVGLVRSERLIFEDAAQRQALENFMADPARTDALAYLKEAVRADMRDVLRPLCCSDNFPVRLRLLDAPPQEFFGPALQQETARRYGARGARGAALACQLPALYEAQIHAIFLAYRDLHEEKDVTGSRFPPLGPVEILAPYVRTAEELMLIKDTVGRIGQHTGFSGPRHIRFGSMLETTEAAENSGILSPLCDFISIGSNDLTEAVLGCRRDDGAARHALALASGRLEDPFVVLHDRVLGLLQRSVAAARQANPAVEIDLCGQHAAHVPSLVAMRGLELNAVSLSPSARHHMALPYLLRLALFDLYETRAAEPAPAALPVAMRPGPHQ